MSIKLSLPHKTPVDLLNTLNSSIKVKSAWKSLTPLARNEWICWITSTKKAETRARRLKITRENLIAGKRRPCCWAGCPHR